MGYIKYTRIEVRGPRYMLYMPHHDQHSSAVPRRVPREDAVSLMVMPPVRAEVVPRGVQPTSFAAYGILAASRELSSNGIPADVCSLWIVLPCVDHAM